MKRMPVLLIGLLLLALLAGTVQAAAEVAQPVAQRATATASARVSATAMPAPRIPVALTVLPLPVTLVAMPTSAVLATPLLTGTLTIRVTPLATVTTPSVRATPTLTPGVRTTATPTPTGRVTPTATLTTTAVPVTADGSETGIVDFRATTSRVRGQIQLSWRYLGDIPNTDLDDDSADGGFVVERSTNGGAWRLVADCTLPFDDETELYRCRDTGLYSGSSYAYRICIAQEVASCAGAVVVETEPIKAP